MKVVHDWNRCESHGVCTAVDPDRFELDDNDDLLVHKAEVSEEELPTVRTAIASCPRQALSLQE
ncbi:MAG TPA: ferredoxin [Mycobacteriales bacterium]|nr:ferredoxin [Mycobacteriales bacterium]